MNWQRDEKIFEAFLAGKRASDLAAEYGMTGTNIARIVRRFASIRNSTAYFECEGRPRLIFKKREQFSKAVHEAARSERERIQRIKDCGPELLDALEGLIAYLALDQMEDSEPEVIAKAAIAKARGQ